MRQVVQAIAIACLVAAAGILLAAPGDKPLSEIKSLSETPTSTNATSATGDVKGAKARNKQPLAFTPEREAAAMNFVERNHPELGELLDHLKTSQPNQYEQAIKEIYRVTERLANFQERDPLHYELEVKLWTAQSRVQLLAARLKMGDAESLKKDLRDALAAQIDARLDVLKHQQEQAAERLSKMDSEIKQLESNKDKAIDRQLENLSRAAGGKLTKAPGARPGAKSNKRASKDAPSKTAAP